ncbi:YheC/YheD family protein [Lederbergia citri]|uniref:YheC/YheD family protein n=1 Tax=Lederbergia citri TaxID=2833580 RepID=A0A942YFV7_9BACI|nr:YheC/YheD family protein [Lederbergia citri]MBS4194897.1 YheC/YheD family protein [Lederbergia citri]
MNIDLGKWQQYLLLKQNPVTANSIPKTKKYSIENLLDLLSRFDNVYVKHDSSGQGRGVFKAYVEKNGKYCFSGFSISGKPIKQCVDRIKDFHRILRPYEKFGRLGKYIIQEGIQSVTRNGLPFGIRVHVQKHKGKWLVSGMIAKIGTRATIHSGILNFSRGAKVISIDELLSIHLKLEDIKKKKVIADLEKLSISAAKMMDLHSPDKEYGIDFGINPKGKPFLYEVNRNPGVAAFAEIENKVLLKRIMKIRRLEKKG